VQICVEERAHVVRNFFLDQPAVAVKGWILVVQGQGRFDGRLDGASSCFEPQLTEIQGGREGNGEKSEKYDMYS